MYLAAGAPGLAASRPNPRRSPQTLPEETDAVPWVPIRAARLLVVVPVVGGTMRHFKGPTL